MLPLGREAIPKLWTTANQENRGACFTTAAQSSGSKLPRHNTCYQIRTIMCVASGAFGHRSLMW
ncbi:hypothetical protein EB795_20140 [Pseudomonas mandelii]|nr:hypothetical protein [Pseudomonas mandelii]